MDATQTQDPNLAPTAADAERPQVSQALEGESTQAPDSTADHTEQQATPETTEERTEREELGITREQYEQLQQQLAERDTLLANLRQMAEEQEAARREQEWQSGLKTKLQSTLKRAIDNGSDEEIIDAAYEVLTSELGTVKQNYEGQMNSYVEDVRSAFWAATMPGFAEDLVKQHNLPSEVKNDLLQFKTEQEMTTYALRVKAALNTVQTAAQRQAVEQEVQQRRESGVNAMGGMQGGSNQPRTFEPGTTTSLAGALHKILGV